LAQQVFEVWAPFDDVGLQSVLYGHEHPPDLSCGL
jgi:hypothetical protein